MRIAGLRTSVALEPQFWLALTGIAHSRSVSLPTLFAEIDIARRGQHPDRTLASAARVFALKHRL